MRIRDWSSDVCSSDLLIPLIIVRALAGKPLPLYGDGQNVRDWLYVQDHASAVRQVLYKGKVGETYNVGGRNEKNNMDVVKVVCEILDSINTRNDGKSYANQNVFVKDRQGNDRRY